MPGRCQSQQQQGGRHRTRRMRKSARKSRKSRNSRRSRKSMRGGEMPPVIPAF